MNTFAATRANSRFCGHGRGAWLSLLGAAATFCFCYPQPAGGCKAAAPTRMAAPQPPFAISSDGNPRLRPALDPLRAAGLVVTKEF